MRSERRKRTAAAAMEFAFWLPVLMILVGGIIDVGWYLSRYQNVVRAARDGARVGASTLEDQGVAPGSQIQAAAIAQSKAVLEGLGMPCGATSTCRVDAVWDTSTDRAAVVVTVTYPHKGMVGIVPVPTKIVAQFTMMTQQQNF